MQYTENEEGDTSEVNLDQGGIGDDGSKGMSSPPLTHETEEQRAGPLYTDTSELVDEKQGKSPRPSGFNVRSTPPAELGGAGSRLARGGPPHFGAQRGAKLQSSYRGLEERPRVSMEVNVGRPPHFGAQRGAMLLTLSGGPDASPRDQCGAKLLSVV